MLEIVILLSSSTPETFDYSNIPNQIFDYIAILIGKTHSFSLIKVFNVVLDS